MSVDAGIHIQIEAESSDWPLSVLDNLTQAGWKMDDHGKVVILPLGDDDDFEWTEYPPGAGDVREVFKSKHNAGEPLGVVLTWGETQIGGTLIIRASGTLTFSASINRQCLGDSSATDVSWYTAKLLEAIDRAVAHISSWEWTETG